MKRAILKGYRNGQAIYLINKVITEDYTLTQFQDERIKQIEADKKEYYFNRFETELRTV
jgi:hypothetical protein